VTPPYEQSGANMVFWTLFGLFAVGEYAMRFRSRFNRGGKRAERWSLLVVVAAVVGGILGGLQLAHWHAASIGAARWPLFVVGLALMATGVLVRQWAIFVLGRFFTVDVRVHPNQTVVDRGPYRWVRHPSYSGLVLFFVGLADDVPVCGKRVRIGLCAQLVQELRRSLDVGEEEGDSAGRKPAMHAPCDAPRRIFRLAGPLSGQDSAAGLLVRCSSAGHPSDLDGDKPRLRVPSLPLCFVDALSEEPAHEEVVVRTGVVEHVGRRRLMDMGSVSFPYV
jgi:protein-S-isoprenylcysteine O-methyltransferase Ste14